MTQKNIKKILSAILAVCMLVSMFAITTASAYDELTFKADSTLSMTQVDDLKIISGFSPDKTVEDLLSNFEDASSITVKNLDEQLDCEAIVGTGTVLNYAEDEAYVVIIGDVDGNGSITATDYLKIKGAFLNITTIEGIYALAADSEADGELDATDYLKIKNFFLSSSYTEDEDDTTSDDTTSDDTTSDDTTSDDTTSDDTTSDDITSDDTTSEDTTSEDVSEEVSYEYILNIKSKKIHIPTCSGLKTTSEANKQGYNGDIDSLLADGYTICGTCKAGQTESSEDVDSTVDTTSEDVTSEDATSEDATSEDASEEVSYDYILNIKSKKIHIPTCSGLKTTSEKNKQGYNGDIDSLLADGYTICGTCKAGQTESSEDVDSTVDTTSEDVTSEDVTSEDVTSEDVTSEDVTSEDATSEDTTSEDSSDDTTSDETESGYTVVTAPEAETAYKFVLTQAKRGEDLYFTGEMNGFYLATSTSSADAIDVYLEELGDGFALYFYVDSAKKYINIVEREDAAGKQTINISDDAAAIYKFDSERNILITTVTFQDGTTQDFYFGTYNTFNTISSSKTSYISDASVIGVSQFPAYLATLN